jgi:two-component system response regulator FlrC
VKPQPIHAPLALWLDPEAPLTEGHALLLHEAGWAVLSVGTLEAVAHHAPHAQAVVVRLPGDTTRLHAVMQTLREAGLALPVVCRVERQALELAVQASQEGAAAVVASHESKPETWARLRENLQSQTLQVSQARKLRHVVFVDPASQHLLALAQKVAQAQVTALLVGPTGAGKEVLARVLHEASPRVHGPFVALNCAAMPDNLIEDMLFGHEKGAFTGAHREHKGVFEQAQGGTLFLDEIGEMPMHLQSKLLRVLQEKQLTRLGGQTLISLDVRIVAATNKDLRQAIANREFREDLYYRIATFRMRLLPLKDRQGDIIPLALHCLVQSDPAGKAWQIHPAAQARLLQYPWPGNVRELENVMRRAMVLCPDHCITPAHLMFDDWIEELPDNAPSGVSPNAPAVAPDMPVHTLEGRQGQDLPLADTAPVTAPDAWPLPAAPSGPTQSSSEPPPIPRTPAAVAATLPTDLHSAARLNEHHIIMATLASTPSKQEAAKRLGISPRTLRYKLAQLREMGLGMQTATQGAAS